MEMNIDQEIQRSKKINKRKRKIDFFKVFLIFIFLFALSLVLYSFYDLYEDFSKGKEFKPFCEERGGVWESGRCYVPFGGDFFKEYKVVEINGVKRMVE